MTKTKKPSSNSLSRTLLASYEEQKKNSSPKTVEEKEQQAKRQLEQNLQPHRDAYDIFDEKTSTLAYNFLIHFQSKIFDWDNLAHYEIDWGRGRGMEKVLLPKLTTAGEPIFEALKHTYGFRSFVTWVRYLDGFGKECLAQQTCESLGWVLRYGEDRKGEVERRKQFVTDRLGYWRAKSKKRSDSPKWIFKLTTDRQFANNAHKEFKRRKKLITTVNNKKEESAKLRRLRESQQRHRNLVKRDAVILEYEMMENKTLSEKT